MRKLLSISLIITFLWPILTYLLCIVLFPSTSVKFSLRETIDWIFLFFAGSYFVIFTVLFGRVYRRFRLHRIPTLGIFLIFLLCINFAAGFGILWTLFGFSVPIYNIAWLTTSTYMNYAAMFYLLYFNIELFEKGVNFGSNRKILLIFGGFIGLGYITQSLQLLLGSPLSITILNSSISFLAGVYSFGRLSYAGFIIAQKVVERTPKLGFLLIGWAGLIYILGSIMNILYAIFIILTASTNFYINLLVWSSWTFWGLGGMLIYFGFTYPMRHTDE